MTTLVAENGELGHPCPDCGSGVVTQCDVSGDHCCDSCDWWIDADDADEDIEDE